MCRDPKETRREAGPSRGGAWSGVNNQRVGGAWGWGGGALRPRLLINSQQLYRGRGERASDAAANNYGTLENSSRGPMKGSETLGSGGGVSAKRKDAVALKLERGRGAKE